MAYRVDKLKEQFLPIIEELSFSSNKEGDLLNRAQLALQELLDKVTEAEYERIAEFEN